MTGIKWQLTPEVIIAAEKPRLQRAYKLNDLMLLVVVFPRKKDEYSSVNSNRSRSCAKVISVLDFSSALLFWTCSACQPALDTVSQCCRWWQGSPLPFPSSPLAIAFTRSLTSKAASNHLQHNFGAGRGVFAAHLQADVSSS